jgi:phage terminase Nu1 subunit (DNA packaging protein)
MRMKAEQAAGSEVAVTEVCSLLEVDARTVYRWWSLGLPRLGRGETAKMRWADLLRFLYHRKPLGDGPLEGSESPALERSRLADAVRKERQNALDEGRLRWVEDVMRDYRAIAHTLRTQLESLIRLKPEIEAELRAAFETAAARLEGAAR